jgi:glutathione S-transferase
MITLFTFGPAFGLPDLSPFVTKAHLLLRLANLPYETNRRGYRKSPQGKLPYIADDSEIIADSTFIRRHIEHKYRFDFDDGLSGERKALMWALEKMCENHLYWAALYERWMKQENFEMIASRMFKSVPGVARPLVKALVQRKMRKDLHCHGMGRHSEAEIIALAERDVDACAVLLGDDPWFGGERPCGGDATLAAFAIAGLAPFKTEISRFIRGHANLVAYAERATATYFPELSKRT